MGLEKYQELDPELEALAQAVIGAAIEVHRQLGPGFLESVYEKALSIELSSRNIPHACQHPTQVCYRGAVVGEGRIDILVAERLILELKCIDRFEPIHEATVISYLKATNLNLGLLINFRKPRLVDGLKRVVYTPQSPSRTSRPSPLRGESNE
ncbi:GxxExxY protein [Phycisphaerales bacterium AB-hyl4]|uniref:GxxExxY protein n=1 Tax=Natronomicrosphaera hydrolytica TaxID=3242702 RepID=A0ABV4U2Z8_9BACT